MRRTHARLDYADSAYDAHFCLKPPLLLWMAVLYLSRAVTLPLAMGIGQAAGVDPAALSALRGAWDFDAAVLPSVPAAAMLYAFFRRVPGASRPVRFIWRHGVLLLALAAALDFSLSMLAVWRVGDVNDRTLLSACSMVMDACVLLYVLGARRVRDTFSEFPPAPLAEA